MLNSVSLRGVKDIRRVFLLEHDKIVTTQEGTIKTKLEKEWVLETDGVNLKTVMCIDGVDFQRTYSNSCIEIFNVLGIEAARAAIMKELRGVIEFDGSYVNYRHLALLCDRMTHRGTLMSITRHGINRADTGALMRCSFEETVEILMKAAAVGEKDDCHGVAENVMFGQMAPMGTGAFDVTQRIFPIITRLCSPISIRRGYVSIWDFTIRNFALLRSCAWGNIANIFSHISWSEPELSWLFAHLTIILSDVTPIQPSVSVIQPNIPTILANKSVIQSGISTM